MLCLYYDARCKPRFCVEHFCTAHEYMDVVSDNLTPQDYFQKKVDIYQEAIRDIAQLPTSKSRRRQVNMINTQIKDH